MSTASLMSPITYHYGPAQIYKMLQINPGIYSDNREQFIKNAWVPLQKPQNHKNKYLPVLIEALHRAQTPIEWRKLKIALVQYNDCLPCVTDPCSPNKARKTLNHRLMEWQSSIKCTKSKYDNNPFGDVPTFCIVDEEINVDDNGEGKTKLFSSDSCYV